MAFGRFERGKAGTPMADINVTPMVDVMLVLVVIFIITAPLLAASIRLDLPRAEGAQAGAPPQFVTVSINRDGQVFLGDQAVAAGQLAQKLRQAALQDPATELQLRADQDVAYGRVVEVMDLAQRAGLSRIGFVAETPQR